MSWFVVILVCVVCWGGSWLFFGRGRTVVSQKIAEQDEKYRQFSASSTLEKEMRHRMQLRLKELIPKAQNVIFDDAHGFIQAVYGSHIPLDPNREPVPANIRLSLRDEPSMTLYNVRPDFTSALSHFCQYVDTCDSSLLWYSDIPPERMNCTVDLNIYRSGYMLLSHSNDFDIGTIAAILRICITIDNAYYLFDKGLTSKLCKP